MIYPTFELVLSRLHKRDGLVVNLFDEVFTVVAVRVHEFDSNGCLTAISWESYADGSGREENPFPICRVVLDDVYTPRPNELVLAFGNNKRIFVDHPSGWSFTLTPESWKEHMLGIVKDKHYKGSRGMVSYNDDLINVKFTGGNEATSIDRRYPCQDYLLLHGSMSKDHPIVKRVFDNVTHEQRIDNDEVDYF